MRLRDIAMVFVTASLALLSSGCGGSSSGGGGGGSSATSGQIALEVSGLPTSLTAGQAATFAVIARLPTGEAATTYRGTVSFASTDPQATVPADYTFQASDAGARFFTAGLTLRSAGARTLSVADVSFPQVAGAKSVSVTPGAAASLQLTLAASEPSSRTFAAGTLSAVDAFGNPTTFDASTSPVTVSATPAGGVITGLGSLGAATLDRVSDFVAGTATLGGRMTVTAPPGTYTFSAASASGLTSNAAAVTLFAPPAQTVSLEVQGITNALAAGDSTTIVVIARDQSGSITTQYAGTVTFSADDPQATVPASYTFTPFDSGVHVFPNGVTFRSSGPRTIRATDAAAGLTGASTLTVTAGPLAAFTLDLPATHVREQAFAAGTVTAVDAFGNTVTTFDASSDPVVIGVVPDGTVFGLGGAGDALDQAGDFVQGAAALAGRLRYAGAVGSRTFTATSASAASGTSTAVAIQGIDLSFSLSGLPTSTQAGTANQLLVAVRDNFGALVTSYTGTVTFASNDPQASLPAAYTFTAQDTGIRLFTGVTLKTAGSRTITVRDAQNPTVLGTVTATVTTGPVVRFGFTLPAVQRQGAAFGASATVTALDAFDNAAAFNAALDPVSITAAPADGTISGLTSGNLISGAGSFVNGTASLAAMVFTGLEGNHTFFARSASGIGGTSTAVSIENPIVFGLAEYADVNLNGLCDAGDTLTVPFGTPVSFFSPIADDMRLFVAGDAFGNGATLGSVAGRTSAARVTLGSSANLKTRGIFSGALTGPGSASGVDVFPGQDGVRVTRDGTPVLPSAAIDVFALPHAVDSGNTVRTNPRKCAVVFDFDLDGDLDVYVGQSNELRLFRNNFPSRSFASNVFGSIGERTADVRALAAGDFDRNGTIDFVAAVAGGVRAYEVNGSPPNDIDEVAFALSDFGLGAGVADGRAVSLVDIDQDGDLDIVAGMGSGQGTKVFLGSGGGSFADSAQGTISTGLVTAQAVGDLNGDGAVDLVSATSANPMQVFFYDLVNGLFVDTLTGVGDGGALAVELVDLDRDGDLDILESRADGVRLHRNNGLGAFTTVLRDLAPGPGLFARSADVDRDGDRDVFVTYAGAPATILLNDGAGTLSRSGVALRSDPTTTFATADFDKDGDADFLTLNSTTATDFAYWGSVAGTFGDPLAFVNSGQNLLASPQQVGGVSLDIDGDGDLDVATVADDFVSQGLRIYRNNGQGTFTTVSQGFSALRAKCLAAGDFDNDGDIDIAMGTTTGNPGATFDNTVVLYENNGAGTFAQASTASTFGATTGGVTGIAFYDYDRDGDQDLICVAANDAPRVYPNNPRGTFSSSTRFAISLGASASQASGLATYELNRKDEVGLAVATTAGTLQVGLLSFNGSIAGLGTVNTSGARLVAAGDVNGDGRPDLLTGGPNGPDTQVVLMTTGTFQENLLFGTPASLPSVATFDTVAVALADADGDGDLDAWQAGSATRETRIFLNNGAGTFTDSTRSLPHNSSGTPNDQGLILPFDVDRDGDIDVVTGVNHNNAAVGVRVFRNQ